MPSITRYYTYLSTVITTIAACLWLFDDDNWAEGRKEVDDSDSFPFSGLFSFWQTWYGLGSVPSPWELRCVSDYCQSYLLRFLDYCHPVWGSVATYQLSVLDDLTTASHDGGLYFGHRRQVILLCMPYKVRLIHKHPPSIRDWSISTVSLIHTCAQRN